MSNEYTQAIQRNAETVKARNKAKAQKLVMLANDARCYDALKANNVQAERFADRALYATEKCVKIVYKATRDVIVRDEDFNENAFATIKSAILALENAQHLTKRDIECALSKDQKCDEARKALIYRRNALLSENTLAAQSQQCVDMLRTLNIAREVAKNTFEIRDCSLMQQFKSAFAQIA